MTVRVEKPQKSFRIFPVIIVLVIILAIACAFLIPFFFTVPFSPLALEITSFEGDVWVSDLKGRGWHAPSRGEQFQEGQKIKTGTDGVLNLQVENQIMLRVKENGELINKKCRRQDQRDIYKLFLKRGSMLGATTKEFDRKVDTGEAIFFVVTTPHCTVTPKGAVFRIVAGQGQVEDAVGVLRGSVEMTPSSFFFKKKGVVVRGLQASKLVGGEAQPARRVTPDEWQEMKESYELLEKTAAQEAQQINLSKLAGSFFEKVVFDHGTFYTPKIGYTGREFFVEPDSKEVLLETEYDVFPEGSFAGIYYKTRNFDASHYEGLNFEVRRRGEEGFPDAFLIELKSKGNVVRRFLARGFHRQWTQVYFPFHVRKKTPISEMVFVFTNEKAGSHKKGMLELRNFDLIPKKEEPLSANPIVQSVQTLGQTTPFLSAPAALQKPDSSTTAPVSSRRSQPTASSEGDDADDMVPLAISLR